MAVEPRRWRLFIDNRWLDAGDGETTPVINPTNGTVLGRVAVATAADVDKAVAAAHRAFTGWSDRSGVERGTLLDKIADQLQSRREEIVTNQVANSGKPLVEAGIDADDAIATYRYYAGEACRLDARQDTDVQLAEGFAGRTRFEPLGVAGLIVPWNFPLVTSGWKVAAALAGGCTVVLKASEFTPSNELLLGEAALAAGLPAGVVNIVTGGPDCGRAICEHPLVAKISFTGSNRVGQEVMATAARRSVPTTLELGGKSAIVAFGDSDPYEAAQWICDGIFYNAGQVCSATSRLLVERNFEAALRPVLLEKTEAIRLGDPADPSTGMGPMTMRAQYNKVISYFDIARQEGLSPSCGGHVVDRNGGLFIAPTVYWDVPATSRLWREEIFGPVLCVRSFSDEDDAVRQANESDYGLAATIVGRDQQRNARLARRLRAGHIWINSAPVVFPQSSWGGFKASGTGRELGPWGMAGYMGTKHITEARSALTV